jgi:adenine-specific DNA-methyltransferase
MCKLYNLERLPPTKAASALVHGDSLSFLRCLPRKPVFDLVVTSPPYNLGKSYEKTQLEIADYLKWQGEVIDEIVPRIRPRGSVCWQVGNYVENGAIEPLDVWLHPLFKKQNLKLRNRIVWRFGHGLHCSHRFSGRYEVVLWYTRSDEYTFNLNAVRIPAKYPQKRYYKGPNVGKFSGHIGGKNPEDVWEIPNVKGNHCEKTIHPCQFPVGLVERLVLALTRKGALVYDPYCGVGSSGVAAVTHSRRFLGCDKELPYLRIASKRIEDAASQTAIYRRHDEPIFDASKSPLSKPRSRRSASANPLRRPA